MNVNIIFFPNLLFKLNSIVTIPLFYKNFNYAFFKVFYEITIKKLKFKIFTKICLYN